MKIKFTTIAIAALFLSSNLVLAAGGGGVLADPGAMQGKHFDLKGKAPSSFTVELQNGLRKTLPFEDKRDFEESKKGFIAAPAFKTNKFSSQIFSLFLSNFSSPTFC
jgi:hypothetical protein